MYLPLRLRQVRTKDQMRSFTAHDMQRLNIPVRFPGFVPDESRSHLVDKDEALISAQCIHMSRMHLTIHINSYQCLRSNRFLEMLFGSRSQDKKSRPYSWFRVFSCQSTVFIYNLLWRKLEYTKTKPKTTTSSGIRTHNFSNDRIIYIL